jgi:hypothetical protein
MRPTCSCATTRQPRADGPLAGDLLVDGAVPAPARSSPRWRRGSGLYGLDIEVDGRRVAGR